MAEKRKLPVLQTAKPAKAGADAEEPQEPRPPWHWTGFGTVAIFATWLPLAYAAQAIGYRRFGVEMSNGDAAALTRWIDTLTPEERTTMTLWFLVPHALALAIASFVGGFLIGRWGAPAGVREAAIAGVATSLVSMTLASTVSGFNVASASTLLLTIPFSALGAYVGKRVLTRAPKQASP